MPLSSTNSPERAITSVEAVNFDIANCLYRRMGVRDSICDYVDQQLSGIETEEDFGSKAVATSLVDYCNSIADRALETGNLDYSMIRNGLKVAITDVAQTGNKLLGNIKPSTAGELALDSLHIKHPDHHLYIRLPDEDYYTDDRIADRYDGAHYPHRDQTEADEDYLPRFIKYSVERTALWSLVNALEEPNKLAHLRAS